MLARIMYECLAKRPNVILAQYAFPDGFTSVLASKVLHVPAYVQVIGSDLRLAPKGLKKGLISIALRHASGIACVSRDLQRHAKTLGGTRTAVIPTPLDLSDFCGPAVTKRDERRLVTVAMLTPTKGIDVLLRAIEPVNSVSLTVIGDGPERGRLEALRDEINLGDRVEFLGFVPHTQIWRNLWSSRIFVLPSLSEGLPRALLEAMACGMFVIASSVGGIPEVITHNANGFLVEAGDADGLRNAIQEALSNPALTKGAEVINMRRAKKYELELVSKRMIAYLREAKLNNQSKRTRITASQST